MDGWMDTHLIYFTMRPIFLATFRSQFVWLLFGQPVRIYCILTIRLVVALHFDLVVWLSRSFANQKVGGGPVHTPECPWERYCIPSCSWCVHWSINARKQVSDKRLCMNVCVNEMCCIKHTVEARLSGAALHHAPSWSNRPKTAWRCVLGHCPVEK